MNKIYQAADLLAASLNIVQSPSFILLAKIIFLGLSGAMVVFIIYLLIKTDWIKSNFLENLVEITTYRPFGVQKTFKQWAKITKRLEKGKDIDYKMAVIEADSLLYSILKKMNYSGETMRDVLEQVDAKILPKIDDIWYAHKLRNNIVHESAYELNLDYAKKAMKIYEQAFRDLQLF